MGDLIIVSNRGPFSFTDDFLKEAENCFKEGTRPTWIRFGEGGLVQAMSGLLRPGRWKTTWLGASLGNRDIDVARGHYNHLFQKLVQDKHAPQHFPYVEIEAGNRMRFKYKDYDFYMRFVFFDTEHMYGYYSKFANGFLWPLMHLTRSPLFYKKTRTFPRPRFKKNNFVQYTSSGVTFAHTINDEILKSDELQKKEGEIVVWNQDYHLMQVAQLYKTLLRDEEIPSEARRQINIGQFIHTPFFNIHEIQGLIRQDKRERVKAKAYDPFGETIESALQKLTWGMLSNDFIGFHTKEYCDHYLESLEEWFPVHIRVNGQFYEIFYQDNVTTIGAFPIGLDVDKILSEVSEGNSLSCRFGSEDLQEKINADRKAGRYIFGGIERCDYTKGLVERLGIFFNAYNNLRSSGKDARFYQVTAPSRSDSPDYQNLNTILEEAVSKMNAKLPGSPITHIDTGISPPQNYRFMTEVDVMLVTPLEDGMNLVAFEYILSQKYKHPKDRGILVLSMSGASRVLKQKGFGEMDGIVYINPMKFKDAGDKAVTALLEGNYISDRVISYVEKERRVDDWAERNINAILDCQKTA